MSWVLQVGLCLHSSGCFQSRFLKCIEDSICHDLDSQMLVPSLEGGGSMHVRQIGTSPGGHNCHLIYSHQVWLGFQTFFLQMCCCWSSSHHMRG